MMLFLLACKADVPADAAESFPADFVWGSATAGFQVDMGCPTLSPEECRDTNSDWYRFVTDDAFVAEGSLFITGESVDAGPGMWELFEEDVARMEADGMTGYRFSMEWSRLFPDGGSPDAAALPALADPGAVARYHEELAALAAAGIRPMVTLNHYTLPLWVHEPLSCRESLDCEASGWLDGDRIVPLIAAYASWAGQEFGGEVDNWGTLNEPLANVMAGYLVPGAERSHPPGVGTEGAAAKDVLFHQIEGHAAMYDALHASDLHDADGDGVPVEVGVVLNISAIVPVHPEEEDDQLAAAHLDHLLHRTFLDGLTSGSWDEDLDGEWDTERDELAGRLDWIGVNYYNKVPVMGLPFSPIAEIPILDVYPEITWAAATAELFDAVMEAAEYGLPIWITENGTPDVEGDNAVTILEGHLASLHAAMGAGADVRGYFYWSFIDNYEWNHGMDMRFGLYALDVDTKARTARPVLERYREIMAHGAL